MTPSSPLLNKRSSSSSISTRLHRRASLAFAPLLQSILLLTSFVAVMECSTNKEGQQLVSFGGDSSQLLVDAYAPSDYYSSSSPLYQMLLAAEESRPEKRGPMPGVLRFGKRDSDNMPGVLRFGKRDADNNMPGVLRFGKRALSFVRFGRSDSDPMLMKKEMPGVLRFGKRSDGEKKAVPGVLRFGKRDMPGVLRFGKREMDMDSNMPGVLRFGRRSVPGVLRFG